MTGGITWFYGNRDAGKSTKARWLQKKTENSVVLDGDDIRKATCNHDLSEAGRRRLNWTVADLALTFQKQDLNVICATICPYKDQRNQIETLTGCEFIYLGYEGDDKKPESPFERP